MKFYLNIKKKKTTFQSVGVKGVIKKASLGPHGGWGVFETTKKDATGFVDALFTKNK